MVLPFDLTPGTSQLEKLCEIRWLPLHFTGPIALAMSSAENCLWAELEKAGIERLCAAQIARNVGMYFDGFNSEEEFLKARTI